MNNQNSNLKTLLPLLLLVTIDSIGVGLVFPVLSPLFMRPGSGMLAASAPLGLRDFYYALTLGLFAIAMFIATPILGDMSDRFGRKRVLLFCLLGTGLGSLLCAVAISIKSISLLLFGRFLGGLAASSQPIAQAAIIDNSTQENKTKNIGLMSLAGCLGFALGPVLGGVTSDKALISWFNFTTPFIITGILAFLNAWLLNQSYKNEHQTVANVEFALSKQIQVFVEAITDPQIRNLSLVLLCYETGWALYFQYISIFLLQRYDLSTSAIGLFMSYVAVVLGITFLVIIRILLRYFKEAEIAVWSLFIAGIIMLAPLLFHGLIAQYLISMPVAVGAGLIWNMLLALFSNSVGQERQGWVMGVSSAVVSVAWILGSFLTGLLDYIGMFLPFICAGILLILGGLALLPAKKIKEKYKTT